MKKRIKAQALALVLIVIAISVVIAFAITSRVVEDIKQQGQEKSSTRAEALSESATEKVTQMIQAGELSPTGNENYKIFSVNDQISGDATEQLGICETDSTDVEKKCDPKSTVEVTYYKMIVQFKLFNSESIEVHLVHPDVEAHKTDTDYDFVKTGNNTQMILHVKNPSEQITSYNGSFLTVKSFWRVASTSEVRLSSECIINLSANTATCLPAGSLTILPLDCPEVTVGAGQTTGQLLGDKCYTVAQASGNGVSFYRIKPLLVAANTESSDTPYIDISATGAAPSYELPEYQMAFINSGVYSGEEGSDNQVFQQTTRLMLIHKSVPEIADYVLYNGSNEPITKE